MSRLIDADLLGLTNMEIFMCNGDYKEALKMLIDKIEHAPTIEPKQQWIPVSEKLPEKPDMYTVTDSKGDVVRFIFTGTESSKKYWRRCAKAWMSLPKPYRAESEKV